MTAINTPQNRKLEQKQREWEEEERKRARFEDFCYLIGLLGGALTLLLMYLIYCAMKAGAQ